MDPEPAALVAELRTTSPEFAGLWDEHEVAVRRAATKRFRHPTIGILELDCEVLVNSDHNQQLVIHTARPGTEPYERLQLLQVVGLQDLTPTSPDRARLQAGRVGVFAAQPFSLEAVSAAVVCGAVEPLQELEVNGSTCRRVMFIDPCRVVRPVRA
jgi:hypothetical protein